MFVIEVFAFTKLWEGGWIGTSQVLIYNSWNPCLFIRILISVPQPSLNTFPTLNMTTTMLVDSGSSHKALSNRFPRRKFFQTMPPINTMIYLDLMDPHRHLTTQSIFRLKKKTTFNNLWSSNWRNHKWCNCDIMYQPLWTPEWLGKPNIVRAKHYNCKDSFFIPKNTLDPPRILKGTLGNFTIGVCISNTLASPPLDFYFVSPWAQTLGP